MKLQKKMYSTPKVELLEMLTESAFLTSSTEKDVKSSFEDFNSKNGVWSDYQF